ncbi:MAG: hypothetical protein HZB43_04630 [candidate division Zixibacteria bacterium]|nr:hypothetical protein [candidate division Zixibacteria bacterium]
MFLFGQMIDDQVVSTLANAATQSVSGQMYLATQWGGSLMFTTVVTWLTLIAGISLAVISIGAQSARLLRRLRDMALILTAVSTGIALIIWGTPDDAMLAPRVDLGTMALAAAILGLTAIFVVSARRERYVALLGDAPETTGAREQLLKSVTETIASKSTLNQMLMGVASALRTATGASAALVYKNSFVQKRAAFVGSAVATGQPEVSEPSTPFTMSLVDRYALAGCVCEYQPDAESIGGDERKWTIVPLISDETVVATVLLKDSMVSVTAPPVSEALTLVAGLTGRAISDWVGASAGESTRRLAQGLHQLVTSLLDERTLDRGLPAIAQALKGIVPADYLSVSWLNSAHFHEDRASMITGQRRVVENRHRWPIWDGTTHRLLGMARPLITPDLLQSPEETPADGTWEKRLGLRSRIVLPIRDGERLLGTLTLAHRSVACYGLDETGPLTAFAGCLGLWLKQLEAARTSHRYGEVTSLANQWDHITPKSKTDFEILKEAHRAIKTSALRLYRLTPDGQAMEIVATAGRVHSLPNGQERIRLSDTPWHRCSMEHRTPHRIDQSDPEALMEKSEVELSMLPRMKTGWIVPITTGDMTVGFVDAIETRDPDRQSMDEPERLLLNSLARVYSRRWEQEQIKPPARQRWNFSGERVSEFNHSIINPLTGIIGSVELIRHKQPDLTGESVKYLNVIERSANKIHEAALRSLGTEDLPQKESSSAPALSIPGISTDSTVNRLQTNLETIRNWRLEGASHESASQSSENTPIVR